MSKQNTLLNYFTKTPVSKIKNDTPSRTDVNTKSPQTPKSKTGKFNLESPKENGSNVKTPVQKKRNRNSSLDEFSSPVSCKKQKKKGDKDEETKENDSPKEVESPPHKKRKRIIMELESDEDSGDEYVPDVKESESSDESEEEDEPSVGGEESSSPSPEKKTSKKKNGRKVQPKTLNASFSADKAKTNLPVPSKDNAASDPDHWPHLKYAFLQPDKIRDAKRRPPSDPNYDPRTLYVPDDFKNSVTPATRQWWDIKAQHFDVVLFFKLGKFYELYNMDAVIAASELSLTFMRGEQAHVGFPESAYGRFSSTLIEKGYKVARIEQTETPEMVNERCKKMSKVTKFDKVVKREVCQITSRGTRVFGILDGEKKEAESNFLLAVAEKEIDSASSLYGVCFIDTSIGLIHIGQFVDDRHSSRFRTLVAHYPPVQILYEKNQISSKTQQLFSTMLSAASKEQLLPEIEFWSASNTLLKLAENYYSNRKFPLELTEFMGQDAAINMTVDSDKELGVRSLGAIVWYLQKCLIDFQLLTMGQFTVYEPVDIVESKIRNDSDFETATHGKYVVLDAITLKNLNVLENSNGGTSGTLLNKLDSCCTSFGKRLLQRWVCSPLKDLGSIKARQEAVTFLRNCSIVEEVRSLLHKLPDLERLLSRIHSQCSLGIQESHPNTRAFFFEEKTYSKKKIIDFVAVLNGFKTAEQIVECFESIDEKEIPALIKNCCRTSDSTNSFPNLTEHLNFFEGAFDRNEALKEGRILPNEGTDADYDEAVEHIKSIEKKANAYLKEQCAHFGCKVSYHGNDKKRYQLEVVESHTKRANSKYELVGQRKGYKRYWTAETKDFLERMVAAEEQKKSVLQNLRERIFAKFSEKHENWSKAIQCLSVLDVLISFAEYSRNENETCVPEFISLSASQQPFIELVDGVYPCSTGDDVFIPNSTTVGGTTGEASNPAMILVTGPNMGGKSTLMRQLGLLAIMAHMGCHVPATQLRLSVVDRIFTRLGANDDIMAGESTFYVELCETSSILQHATKHSLVLIDELGRGTSTYDGTAIASAVLNELSRIKCRTLFSTHYHSLVKDFKNNENIALGHMACMVENDEETESEETVTFLYKFAAGVCPKSYGFNAARLAGMPSHITKLGQQRARELEMDVDKRGSFKKIFKNELNTIRELIAML